MNYSVSASSSTSSSGSTSGATSKRTTALQSLVRTKCWSIAPLWKFVTYELEQGPTRTNFTRSASVRSGGGHQKKVKISYENDMLQNSVPKRRWSKPHPQQSFSARMESTRLTSNNCPTHGNNGTVCENYICHKKYLLKSNPIRTHIIFLMFLCVSQFLKSKRLLTFIKSP